MAIEQRLDGIGKRPGAVEYSLEGIDAGFASVGFSKASSQDDTRHKRKAELSLKGLGVVLSIPIELVGKHSILDQMMRSDDTPRRRSAGPIQGRADRDIETQHGDRLMPTPANAHSYQDVINDQNDRHSDPVIQHLLRARREAERSGDEAGTIYADAVQLALVAKLLSGLGENERKAGVGMQKAPLPKWRLKRAVEYIDTHYSRTITLSDLAAAAGLSRMHFAAQFRLATGLRPREFVLNRRVQLSQQMLMGTDASLVDIALSVGFQTQAHFTTVFKRFVGETPHRWRCANAAAKPY
jgi:AraC-like DNA-binding protein